MVTTQNKSEVVVVFIAIAVFGILLNLGVLPDVGAATFSQGGENYTLIFSNLSSITTVTNNLTQGIYFYVNISNNDSVARTYNITFTFNGSTTANATVNGTSRFQISFGNQSEANGTAGIIINVTNTLNEMVQLNIRAVILNNETIAINSSGDLNFTAIFDNRTPLINFGNGAIPSGSNLSQTWIYVNVSVNESNEANVTFALYNSLTLVNSTTFNAGQRTINWTNLTDGFYVYNVTVVDISSNSNTTSARVTLDTTPSGITILSPRNTTYYINVSTNQTIWINFSATDATSGASSRWWYNETGNTTQTTTAHNLSYSINGTHTYIFYAVDYANNTVNTSVTFNIAELPSTSVLINQTNFTASASSPAFILPYDYSSLSRIDIPSSVTSTTEITLDLSQRVNSAGNATLGDGNVTFTRTISSSSFTVEIPTGVILSGGSSWTGSSFTLPTEYSASSCNIGAISNENIVKVIKIGTSQEITLSDAAKITLPGMGTKSAAYGLTTTLYNITTVCTNASNHSNINTIGPRECYAVNGSDLIIWTHHLSYFAAFNHTVSSGGTTPPGTGGNTDPTEEDDTGFWENITSKTSKDLSDWGEINISLKAHEEISYKIEKKTRYIGVIKTTLKTATINVTSSTEPHQYIFATGEIKKFDVTGDNYYDVQIKLNSIKNSAANITISYVHMLVANATNSGGNLTGGANTLGNVSSSNTTILDGDKSPSSGSLGTSFKIFMIVVGSLLVLGAAGGTGYFYFMKYYREKQMVSKVKVKSP